MAFEQLKLENQLCFPFYAISRLVTKAYKPLLDNLELTYPQYLVLLVLWEKDNSSVKYISGKLLLETNTLTPLLKRMESAKLITRFRLPEDERSVVIKLTPKGKKLKMKAKNIPLELSEKTLKKEFTKKEIIEIKNILDRMLFGIQNLDNSK